MTSVSVKAEFPAEARSQITRLETLAELEAFEPAWEALLSRCTQSSIFATFDYVRLAWEYFHQEGDRLLVLVLRREDQVVAVAPFRVSIASVRGIPVRQVEWIAKWEGDRPGVLCATDPAWVWRRLAHFFAREYRGWDTLRLSEQDEAAQAHFRFEDEATLDISTDSEGYYIPLGGTFDEYLKGVDAKVKSNWRNRSRKVGALEPKPIMHRLDSLEHMAAGVDRLIALERASWKGDAGLGLGKDERHRLFYLALTRALAARGRAAICFLSRGEEDLAGTLLFMLGGVVYERHIAYSPNHAALSPGIVLRADLLKSLFESDWQEFDLMGMRPEVGRQRHKEDWATGRRETVCLQFHRNRGRLLPWLVARRLRSLVRFAVPKRQAAQPIDVDQSES
ncbi:MAG: GNAT family N-acetyltransferase [Burkholderiaceae bacterium]